MDPLQILVVVTCIVTFLTIVGLEIAGLIGSARATRRLLNKINGPEGPSTIVYADGSDVYSFRWSDGTTVLWNEENSTYYVYEGDNLVTWSSIRRSLTPSVRAVKKELHSFAGLALLASE